MEICVNSKFTTSEVKISAGQQFYILTCFLYKNSEFEDFRYMFSYLQIISRDYWINMNGLMD